MQFTIQVEFTGINHRIKFETGLVFLEIGINAANHGN